MYRLSRHASRFGELLLCLFPLCIVVLVLVCRESEAARSRYGATLSRVLTVITRVQAGNGVYELTTTVHPGGGDTFKKLCAGNGLTKGKPLKTVNWASLNGAHPYVQNSVCSEC